MKEVSHKETGGFDPLLTVFTAGAGALTAFTSTDHEVVVEHNGEFGVGHGESRAEARAEAIRDLSDK